MLCEAAAALLSGAFACAGGPAAALAAGLALAAAAVALGWGLWRAAGGRPGLLAPAALAAAAALALGVAAGRPEHPAPAPAAGGLAVALLDVSDSVRRDPAAFAAARAALAGALAAAAEAAGPAAEGWRGQAMAFGAAPAALGAPVPLAQLPAAVAAGALPPPAGESGLAEGLDAALAAIRAAGGRGAVWLLTDGHATGPSPDLAALRAAGVAVHVQPAGSAAPALGLIAADLGPVQHAGRPAVLRATVAGAGRLTVQAPGGEAGALEVPPAAGARGLRVEVTPAQRGLMPVDLAFAPAGAAAPQRRRLYTLVQGPARLLVFGAAPWAEGLSPALFAVERADPARPPPPAAFDVVAVDALAPADFPPGYPAQLLAAGLAGTGLLIVNGPQRGGEGEPQRISDWEASALGPVLPVTADPRRIRSEPPPRDIVIMIDVSGSMIGQPLAVARQAAGSILDALRPADSLAILPFNHQMLPPFGPERATPEALARARRFLAALVADGGTAPDSTLAAAARMRSANCAFFFISDGDFPVPRSSPRCFTTAVGVTGRPFPEGVAGWGEEVLVPPGAGGAHLRLRYFEPEERRVFWRPGAFLPAGEAGGPMAPPLSVEGLALAWPKAGAEVPAWHPDPPPDPLIALGGDPGRPMLAVGVVLSALPAAWGADPAGRAALQALLSRLAGWSGQLRHDIRLRAGPQGLALTVQAAADAGPPPAAMAAAVLLPEAGTVPVTLAPGALPGRFEGGLRPPPASAPVRALLVLSEPGRPDERIPLLLLPDPPAAADGPGPEAFHFGTDRARLAALAAATGGRMLDEGAAPPALDSLPPAAPGAPLHPWWLAAAALLWAAALYLGGARAGGRGGGWAAAAAGPARYSQPRRLK